MKRITHSQALHLARVALADVARQERGNTVASDALKAIYPANIKPIDTRQLHAFARGFIKAGKCPIVLDEQACVHILNSFIQHIKDNAK